MTRALLCSGGAARGPIAQDSLEKLEAKYNYDGRYGVSIGSQEVNAAAAGILPELRHEWTEIDGTDDFMRPNLLHLKDGLFTLKPLSKIFKRLIEPYFEQLKKSSARLGVGMYDLASDRYRTVHITDCETFEEWTAANMASCSEFPIMNLWDVTIRKKGKKTKVHPCADGGFVKVIPALPDWQDYGAIDAILHSPEHRIDPKPPGEFSKALLHSTNRVMTRLVDNVVKADIARLKKWAKAGKDVTLYAPPYWPGDSLDASHETMMWRLEVVGPDVWINAKKM